MKRAHLFLFLVLGSFVFSCPAALPVSAKAATARPNVLFITIDDLRCDLGCYGHEAVRSPNIDALAKRGMRFDRAYVQMTFCNPSRTSFLTGLRPDTTGVKSNRTFFRDKLPDAVTLPQLFRQNGYRTQRLGKIFHGAESMEDPKAWDAVDYLRHTEIGRRGEGRNLTGGRIKWCWWLAAEGRDEDQRDGQIAARAVRFLRGKQEKPFFLALGFYKPHDPFVAPKKYFELYPPEKLRVNVDPADMSPTNPLALGGGWKKEFDRFTDKERLEFKRAYYAGTSFVDAQIGKVLTALKETGLAGSTIIFLMSDHGYHLGERAWWNKNTLFERSCRTPLIVYAPQMMAPGKPCSRLVEFVDIYPTLTELCGITPPEKLQGRSFRPLLDDPAQPGKEAAFTQVERGKTPGRSIRTARWRYIEWGGGREGAELYDHQADGGEWRNLADDPNHAETVRRLKKMLQAHFAKSDLP